LPRKVRAVEHIDLAPYALRIPGMMRGIPHHRDAPRNEAWAAMERLHRRTTMKRIALVAVAALAIAGCQDKESDGWKVGYSVGHRLGERLKAEMADLQVDAFVAGFRDAYTGEASPELTGEQMDETLKAYQTARIEEKRKELQAKADAAKASGDAFLAENGKRAGVTTTASGLQYEVLAQGSGPSPKATDTVKAHYHGTLIDGTVFDSTRERGQPAEFPLNRVIPGWTEGLQLMNRGAKYKFYIPSELGYGQRGAGQKIGANEALVFEVELVDFYPPAQPKK
jgi:FKBP-type peptidyl-prolyl cis-trans isomerase FklB